MQQAYGTQGNYQPSSGQPRVQALGQPVQQVPGTKQLKIAQKPKQGKTERLIIQELGCQLGLMICENNRLKYSIDKKNHEIMRVIESIKATPETSSAQIVSMLSSIVDRYDQTLGDDDHEDQTQTKGQTAGNAGADNRA